MQALKGKIETCLANTHALILYQDSDREDAIRFHAGSSGCLGTSFSPALQFLPLPEEPGTTAVVLPQWTAVTTAEARSKRRMTSSLDDKRTS
jgi:hypothetical protein